MKAFITKHQLNQILFSIRVEYDCFGTHEIDGEITFGSIPEHSNIPIPTPRSIIPFKKILMPNNNEVATDTGSKRKNIALIGITNCDVEALEILYQKFAHTTLLPAREKLLIVSTQCLPDEHCFCTAWGKSEVKKYDLHIQKEETGFSVFAGSKIGEAILKNNSIQAKGQRPKIQKIVLEKKELIDQKELPIAVSDREALKDYWTIVSNNCFGCGSCSIVCPLCFCIRQNFENSATGECKQCLAWDSCFSKGFSEIQNHYDFRPQNIDRLYNWYHHKFVRSHHEDKNFLCTGCGRCIEACPAFLNQYRIIHSLIKKEEKIN